VTAEEYQAQQQQTNAAAVLVLGNILRQYQLSALSPAQWDALVVQMFPIVEFYRQLSAQSGREFFDSERDQHVGQRLDAYLATYELDWLREALRPSQADFQREVTQDHQLATTLLRLSKEVENGGRRTILRAVRSDPVVKGWARIATGRETCAFCLMLVSRGPVFTSAESAGLDLNDTSAADLFAAGDKEALDELTTRWHPGCDCEIAPVYDRSNWPGMDAYQRASQLWGTHTKGYSGKDALNAFRRALERGAMNPGDFALAA
jgi:hypothetical protein